MKIEIITVGTRGDLQPYIAFGLGLQKAGHEVRIISAKNEEAFVIGYGLNFLALDVDIQEIMNSGEVNEMGKGHNPLKFIVGHLKSSKKLKRLMVVTQEEIWNGCQDADVMIFHPGMPIGFFAAKELGKISVLASPFPVVATKDYPSILFYAGPRLGATYNLLTHFIFEKVFWALSKPAIKKFWNKSIESKMNFAVPAIKQQIRSGMPVLNGYSELLFHQPKNKSKNIHTTGAWLLQNDQEFIAPPDLVKFIKAGRPTIYIGFGSMKDITSFKTTFDIILDALKKTGQCAIVTLGWSSLHYNGIIPPNVFLLDSIPHGWLFPQMAVVVHQGGAGTTAAGLMAGKPTVIIPHNADQPAWGQRVYELGVGPKPIKKPKLTGDKLAAAIVFALQPVIVANAKALGQKLQQEDGVQAAVGFIEDFCKGKI